MKKRHVLPKCAMGCFMVLLIVLNVALSWAGLTYDSDGDCDVDGVDLSLLLSVGSPSLSGIALEFGAVEECCEYIGVGSPIDGYPNWQERTMIVFTNMVRMAPIEYRDTYMASFEFPAGGILNSSLYPAVAPLYWNHELNQSARFHAEDMAFNCGLQHDSCDGTSWYDRISSFYPYSVALAENVAYGFNLPWMTVNLFLCERYGSVCEPDGSGSDGHRANIMGDQLREIGTGHAWGSSDYWVQDFGGRQPDLQPPVVAASHAFFEDGVTSFFLNYFDSTGAAPMKIVVVLNYIEYPLFLDTGTVSTGSYRTDVVEAAECRSYFFLVTAGNGVCYRYPATSHFDTYGEGSCLTDYD